MQPVRVVHTEGGDARFNLLGGRVDLGAYSYLLEQQGHDWFIVGDGKTVSPSARSALALFNAAPTIWMSELSTLRSRMLEMSCTQGRWGAGTPWSFAGRMGGFPGVSSRDMSCCSTEWPEGLS
jgi:outer membrane autotransporter protein